jgi:glycosyltransferase involved in cell wall biosynthesis
VALTDTAVCRQGVSPGLFEPAAPRPWGWRLLYVGRIDPRKGIDTAILALESLPSEATLTVMGAGDTAHMAELRRLAADHDLAGRMRFARCPRERLQAVYAEADALVFPVRWEEPWGLVPLEAMSVGTPVVATGRGGSGEYLRDGENCLLFDPGGGPDALAGGLRRLAADEPLRMRLREGGLRTASEITERAWNEAVERLCERALAGGGA